MRRRSLIAFGLLGILASLALVVLLGNAAATPHRTSDAADACSVASGAELAEGAPVEVPRLGAVGAPQLVDLQPRPPRAPHPPLAAALTTAPKTSPPR